MCIGGFTARTLLVTQDMERTDPYCLKKLEKDNNNSSFELAHDGMIRVHDNYLCTYIGKLRGWFCCEYMGNEEKRDLLYVDLYEKDCC